MKLYEVNIHYRIYVVADDGDDAEDMARSAVNEESPKYADVDEITRKSEIDREWRGAIPHGATDDKKVEDYIE